LENGKPILDRVPRRSAEVQRGHCCGSH
jgi:hypothetical protein